MNTFALKTAIGSDGLIVLPFGNGSERILKNSDNGAEISGINFNRHSTPHLCRAVQEGIAFSFKYGIDIMEKTGFSVKRIRAGKSNMFLSRVFRETLASIVSVPVELYNTDGALGAARGAGLGIGVYANSAAAFVGLNLLETTEPDIKNKNEYQSAYSSWLTELERK
jgi:xylulokinase